MTCRMNDIGINLSISLQRGLHFALSPQPYRNIALLEYVALLLGPKAPHGILSGLACYEELAPIPRS